MIIRILKTSSSVALCLVGLFIAVGFYRFHVTIDAPYPELNIISNAELVSRGEYLVHGPAHCSNCHGDPTMRTQLLAGEMVPLTGGEHIQLPIASLYPPNLTPHGQTGIGRLSDGQLLRAMRNGINSAGHPMMPFMPFEELADNDLAAIVAYLRSAKPIDHKVPEPEFNFLGKLIRGYLIKPRGPSKTPSKSMSPTNSQEYGKYLAYKVANCHGCHTNRSLFTGEFTGKHFGGGLELPAIGDPSRTVVSPDIRPGGVIAGWTLEKFIGRFRDLSNNVPGTHMPWGSFSRMTDSDLEAIYRFLMSLPAGP
ncbi:MAG: cytochrome c [Oligoflexales bacterium]